MMDEKIFDYNQYIQERLREIDDLDERRYARQILVEGLANIFSLSEKRYQQLEQRISQELEIPWNYYEIVTTITDRKQYDPIHETLFPVCPEDVSDNNNNVYNNSRKGIRTVYLAADDEVCNGFLREGFIKGVSGEREILYKVTSCKRYEEALESLYHLFLYNKIPWSTVHTGYLERFFDLEPVESAKEEEESVAFQWGKWKSYIREDMIPLWNIKESDLESHKFALPCPDGIYYEHSFTIKDRNKGTFLIGSNADILEVRYEQNIIILKTKAPILKNVKIYQVCNEAEPDTGQTYAPRLTNRKADSFAGRYLYKTGNFLQTGAELFRKVSEMAGDYPISLIRYEIPEKPKMPMLHADMNYFVKDEVFPREQRKQLVFYFKDGEEYLYHSHIRYLLSQIQLEYMEYKCVGVIE